jgi:hypothetical protein
MTDPEPQPVPVTTPAVPCRHLRSKGMYVYTDGYPPEHDDDSTIFWCLKSMKNYGPDDELVDRADCCDPARKCYEPT